jgi:hypothetical protein
MRRRFRGPARRLPVIGAAAVVFLALATPALAAAPPFPFRVSLTNRPVCHLDTAHFRLWWTDHPGAAAAPPDADGRCATTPRAVAVLAGAVEPIRRIEVGLGFPPAPSDAGFAENGGDGRYDVLVDGRGSIGTGYNQCGGNLGPRPLSYTDIGAQRPGGALDALDAVEVRRTFSHEYFHAIQCRMGALLPGLSKLISEGTAEWMVPVVAGASLVDEVLGASPAALTGTLGFLHEVGDHQGSLISTSDGPNPFIPYRYWGFWYGATDGRADPGLIRSLLARIASHPARIARDHGIPDLYAALGPARVRAGLLALAVHGRAGGRFGALPIPHVGWEATFRHDPATLVMIGRRGITASSTRLGLGRLAYRYVRVAWPPGLAQVRIAIGPLSATQVTALAHGVAMIRGDGTVTHSTTLSGPDLVFTQPVAGNAAGAVTIVLTNIRRAPLRVTVRATGS